MTRTRLAGTLIGTVILTGGLSASPAQSTAARGDQPAAEQSAAAESAVVRSLPPVTFSASATNRVPRSPFAEVFAERQRAQVQHAMRTPAPETTRTICGLTMMKQSPDLDAKILLPPDRSEGAAVRRIEPKACTER